MSDREEHAEYAEWAGSYVVGALAPAERQEFDRHLDGCDLCRATVAELAPLPGLLARVDPEEARSLEDAARGAEPDSGPAEAPSAGVDEWGPPDSLEDRLLAAAERETASARPFRPRTVTRVALGAAAAVVVAAGVAIGVPLWQDEEPPDPTVAVTVDLEARADVPLTAEVSLTAVGWGTRVDMTCHYPDQPYGGEHPYSLYVVDTGGRRSLVSRWHSGPGETARTTGSTDLDVRDIARLQLRDGDSGRLLLGWRSRSTG